MEAERPERVGFPISHPSEKTSTVNTINITPEGTSAVVWLHPALVYVLVCALVCMLGVHADVCDGVCGEILFVL